MKRVLLIGVGRWGINHLRILKSMPIELFVADHQEQQLNSTGIPQSHCSTDARSFFFRGAVVVTPAPTHFETCRELLEMRKDVFVEKPMTLVASEPRRLTHYGVWNRLFKSFRDLLAVRWMKSRQIQYEIAESNCLDAGTMSF